MRDLGRLIGTKQNAKLGVGQLCFLGPRLRNTGFFGSGSLALYFGGEGSFKKTVASGVMDIQVLDHDARS